MSVSIIIQWIAADEQLSHVYKTKKEAIVKHKELLESNKYASLVKKTTVTSIHIEMIK